MDKRDIHNRVHAMETFEKSLKDDSTVTETNKKLILEYRDVCRSHGLSIDRRLFYCNRLKVISRHIGKDFNKITKKDLQDFVGDLEDNKITKTGNRGKGKPYSAWSKIDMKIALKRFFKWLKGCSWNGKDFPDIVGDWLKTTMKKKDKPAPKPIITYEEYQKLIEATDNYRDKAIISLLYYGGFRVGELLNIKHKDVQINKDNSAWINVNGKTGQRKIEVYEPVPHLALWLHHHPKKKDKDNYVFITIGNKNKHNLVGYRTINYMIEKAGEKAGIDTSKLNPHNFRHTAITNLVKQGVVGQALKMYAGWSDESKMEAVYTHLKSNDVANIIREKKGLPSNNRDKPVTNEPVICPTCMNTNPAETKICEFCNTNIAGNKESEIQRANKLFQEMQERMGIDFDALVEAKISKGVQEALEKQRLQRT